MAYCRFAHRGFVLSLEAVLALAVAMALLAVISFTYNPAQLSFTTLHKQQLLNDVLEVSARDGGHDAIAEWAGGGSNSSVITDLNRKLAALGPWCMSLSCNGRTLSTCEQSGETVSTVRHIKVGGSFKPLEASLWAKPSAP